MAGSTRNLACCAAGLALVGSVACGDAGSSSADVAASGLGQKSDARDACTLVDVDGTKPHQRCNAPSDSACFLSMGVGCGLIVSGYSWAHTDIPCVPDGSDPHRVRCPVAVGSIEHDLCCATTDEAGNGCNGSALNRPDRACFQEWLEAEYDVLHGNYWWGPFDPDVRVSKPKAATMSVADDLPHWLKAPTGQILGPYRVTGSRTQEGWGRFCQSGQARKVYDDGVSLGGGTLGFYWTCVHG